MDLKTIANELLKVSPLIATTMGGPVGGIIATAIANLLGVATSQIPQAVETDPRAVLKIKAFEDAHTKELYALTPTNMGTQNANTMPVAPVITREFELVLHGTINLK